MIYNQNFLIKMNGREVISIEETKNTIDSNRKTSWEYYHEDGKIYKEEIQYGFKATKGDNYDHTIIASFYSELPLEGFDFSFPMIYGGVNLKRFAERIADTFIPGSWATPKQQEYARAIAENYWYDRD